MKKIINHIHWQDRLVELKDWLILTTRSPFLLKHFFLWLSLKEKGYNTLENKIPWITFEASDWLKSFLKKDMRIFEWGSGGSTLFFLDKVKEVISVEHDPKWHGRVNEYVGYNCRYILIEPRKHENSFPYVSADPSYKGYSFKDYCKAIKFHSGKFDLVSVDGRSRVECVKEGMKKTKRGGYLLLDNSERTEYKEALDLLQNWDRKDFFGPGPYNGYFWRTSIFKKP